MGSDLDAGVGCSLSPDYRVRLGRVEAHVRRMTGPWAGNSSGLFVKRAGNDRIRDLKHDVHNGSAITAVPVTALSKYICLPLVVTKCVLHREMVLVTRYMPAHRSSLFSFGAKYTNNEVSLKKRKKAGTSIILIPHPPLNPETKPHLPFLIE